MRAPREEREGRRLRALSVSGVSLMVVNTNLVGAAVVLALLLLVIPLPGEIKQAHPWWFYVSVAAVYVVLAVAVGLWRGMSTHLRATRWLIQDREPTAFEQRAVLRAPGRIFRLQLWLWLLAAVVFGAITVRDDVLGSFWIALTVALTGITTGSCTYLLAELMLRPVATRALSGGLSERLRLRGVAVRAVLAWAMGTGVPVGGVVAIGLVALAGGEDASRRDLAVAMVVLGGTALAVGLLTVTAAARATADPIRGVARALQEVRSGHFDVRTPVYDGTEIGRLQLGFNDMVAGLAERERIRDAFGAYVDPAVARHVLDSGTALEGEDVEVTVMFVDVRNFTAYSSRTSAREVVATINRLFEQAVPLVREAGGHVDKFTGDGFLAVFGAPSRLEDHADRALGAALRIAEAVGGSLGDGLSVGIGLNSGVVVAGNVGGAGRYEFSVIGDVVNVAARVEASTRVTGDTILLTEATRGLVRSGLSLVARRDIRLKGKQDPVVLYAPDTAAPTGEAETLIEASALPRATPVPGRPTDWNTGRRDRPPHAP